MGSLLRRVKERKKTRRLGEVEVMEQEGYGELEVDSKVEMIRALVPLGLMHVHELLDAEVSELAGERYVRKSETVKPGTAPGQLSGGLMTLSKAKSSRPRKEPIWEVCYEGSRNARRRVV